MTGKTIIARDDILDVIRHAIHFPGDDAAEAVLDQLERNGLVIVFGLDVSTPPHPAVREMVPVVTYFANRADADEMIAAIEQWKPGMVAHEVEI